MAHIGQGGMADDWWQSAPGKIAAPPIFSWESGAKKKCSDLSGIYGIGNFLAACSSTKRVD